MTPKRVVIAGAGQAGFQAAASLRAEGWDGEITLIGAEPGLPYQRPPLSKGFLLGKQEARHTILRAEAFYAANRFTLRTPEQVTGIDRATRSVTLSTGATLPYDTLILATGARNRTLNVPGATQHHVHYIRTLAEAAALRERLTPAKAVAVIGGGIIGLEAAAAARALGKAVTVIEPQPRLMARVLSPLVSDYFRATHASHGVDIRLNTSVLAIAPEGLILSDGSTADADLVVIGIGVMPNLELARDAGLACGNGITVDEYLRTSDESIYAIGDCAEFPSPFTATRVRLESVQNAVDQASCVAKAIAGHPVAYNSAPWFWTDQFDIRMQIAGLAPQWDQQVLRGDPATRKFSAFYFHQGTLRAVDSVNRPADHLTARKLIASRVAITPAQAADESFDLKSLLP